MFTKLRCKAFHHIGLTAAALLFTNVSQVGGELSTITPTFDNVSFKIPFDHQAMQFEGDGLTGVVWFDYNRDGWDDLFLPNGKTQKNALFRNNRDGTFTNVAAAAGVEDESGGGTGAAAADIDNDGFQDLLVLGNGGISPPPSVGPPQLKLYRNKGDGTFEDITAASGLTGPKTQLSASFGDINNDGYLDVFMTGPGSFGPIFGPSDADPNVPIDITQTNPQGKNEQHRNQLWLNKGDNTFEDISLSSGVDTKFGSCVSMFTDYDNDGWIDLVVGDCNELSVYPTPIQLFRNKGNNTFENVSPTAGLSPVGYWMCMAPGDYDCDGDIDFFVTNFGKKANGILEEATTLKFDHPHALYRNNGNGSYTNVAAEAKVGHFEFGWGGIMTDLNNDGYADIVFAGTLADPRFGYVGPGFGNPGRLLVNKQDGTFADYSKSLNLDLSSTFASGIAHGDFDNDGFEDVLIATSALPKDLAAQPWQFDPSQPILLHNLGKTSGNQNRWIKVRLEGTGDTNRDGVGARVTVAAGNLLQAKEVYAGASFASMNSSFLNFGMGCHAKTDVIKVRWPNGDEEVFDNLETSGNDSKGWKATKGERCEPITLRKGQGRDTPRTSLKKTDTAWSEAEGKADEFLSFFDDNARFQPPDTNAANGLREIRGAVEFFFGLPEFSVTRNTDTVEVSASADLGYTMGQFRLKFKDPSSHEAVDRVGKFATIWHRQAEGSWKVVSDTFNYDSATP